MQVGNNFCIGDDVWIECLSSYRGHRFTPSLVIGSNVNISRWVHITCIEAVEIGSHTLIGSKVLIADHNHGSYSGAQQSLPETPPAERRLGGGGSVIIEENVWIGDNVCILGPSRIGRGAVVASNSVVCGDILANTIAGGIPARTLRQFDTTTMSWERR
jgi:lipopolysaccharide O-acetyltransferase